MADRPTPILVEQAPRKLPAGPGGPSLRGAPPVCRIGAAFVDELYQERRISSVEWLALRDAIWPDHPETGEPLLDVRARP